MANPGGTPENLRVGGGREKGVPNKITQTMRDAVQEAFHNAGGAEYLVKMSKGAIQERVAFANICAKLIPLQMQADVKAALEIIHKSE